MSVNNTLQQLRTDLCRDLLNCDEDDRQEIRASKLSQLLLHHLHLQQLPNF